MPQWHWSEKKFRAWAEFRKNTGQTTSEGGSCDETVAKKVITFYHAEHDD